MGAEVRVSMPITVASLVRNPRDVRPKCSNPRCRRLLMNSGIQKWSGEEMRPGEYDDEDEDEEEYDDDDDE